MGNCASEPKVQKGAADEVPQPPPAELIPGTQEGESKEGAVKVTEEGEKGGEAEEKHQPSLISLLDEEAPEKEESEGEVKVVSEPEPVKEAEEKKEEDGAVKMAEETEAVAPVPEGEKEEPAIVGAEVAEKPGQYDEVRFLYM